MKNLHSLKILTRVVSILSVVGTSLGLWRLFSVLTWFEKLDIPAKLNVASLPVAQLLLSIMAAFVAIRGKSNKGGYLVVLFLAFLTSITTLFYAVHMSRIVFLSLNYVLGNYAGILFIFSMQYFPEVITAADVDGFTRYRPLRWYLSWLLKPLNIWLYFAVIVIAVNTISGMLNVKNDIISDLMILITGFSYMLISYRKSGFNSRNSILWLVWGIGAFILTTIFWAILNTFNDHPNAYLTMCVALSNHVILLLAFFMSIFFASTFNTGFIIKRTLVDGVLFLLVILVYNTIEHFAMHTINEHLGIGDAFASSLLSGILVLILSPLHHKLSSYLGRKLKHGGH